MTATVRNDGLETADTEVPLLIDGDQVDSQTVEIAPGEEAEVTFDVSPSAPGEYSVAVGEADPQSLTVESESSDTASSGDSSGDSSADSSGDGDGDGSDAESSSTSLTEGPGFGTVVAFVALLVSALVLARRQQ